MEGTDILLDREEAVFKDAKTSEELFKKDTFQLRSYRSIGRIRKTKPRMHSTRYNTKIELYNAHIQNHSREVVGGCGVWFHKAVKLCIALPILQQDIR